MGWLGAVTGFLALAVVGLTNQDMQRVRAVYIAMELIVWYAILPLSLASLLTGIIQSLTTVWGLFRHYWVLFKLLINVFATIVLLLYLPTLRSLAGIAEKTPLSDADLALLRSPTAVLHSGAALFLLLVATILAVYKPRGLTPYGRRKQQEQRMASQP